MKITFIRPNLSDCRSSDALEPLVFGILAGLTPPPFQCVLYDERLEPIPLDEPTDLVAITIETFTARRAYQIASHFERRGIPVVLGGYHPTFRPMEALQFASSVVIGDAEGVWHQILADARDGQLKRIYEHRYPALDQMYVDRSIFRGKRYPPVALVQFGRGCRYACDFCSIHAFYRSNLRWRPIDNVVAELRTVSRRFVFFTDDNLFNDRDQVERLLEAIRPLRIYWSCQVSLDVSADRQLVRRMAESGCVFVMIGFESLNPFSLKDMHKPWNQRYGSYDEVVQRFREVGIMVYGGFVLGYDHDTPESFDEALGFALRNKLFLANFNPLAPTPGTPLYDRLSTESRLINDPWWLHAAYRYGDGMFEPKNMSAQQLMEGCFRARMTFNRYGNIARRALDLKANLHSARNATAFALANLTSRREIHRKQGRLLGRPGESLRPVYAEEQDHESHLHQAQHWSARAQPIRG